jgi:hypothetical protein
MKRFLFVAALAAALAGCSSVVPKKVEFFQDKVQKFPEQSSTLRELEREAVSRAQEKTEAAIVAAVAENASTNVVAPAKEAQVLISAVATVIGPPKTPAPVTESSEKLATKLETSVAKFSEKVESFKQANNENAGKKIEGTGLFQIGYIYWVGGIILGVIVLFIVGKLVLTAAAVANPGAAIGLNAVNVAESVAAKGFSQLVKGGEDFKAWVQKEITDSGLKAKILSSFQGAQMKSQDSDVQNVVQALTK